MLEKQYLKSRPVCKVTFYLPLQAAPDAKEVKVLGDFNNWDPQAARPMKRNGQTYKQTLELAPGKIYAYRYLIDGQKWENDWSADAYQPGPFGPENSLVIVDRIEAPKKTKRPTGKPDNLKKIEGIGPKIAELLTKEGIRSFADLAEATTSRLEDMLAAAGNRYKAHDPTTWPRQAALARDKQWDKLEALQDSLQGGKPAQKTKAGKKKTKK